MYPPAYDCNQCAPGRRIRTMCSYHYGVWRRSQGGEHPRPRYQFTCRVCGAMRVASRSDAQYCEDHAAPWKRIARDRVCEWCGVGFKGKTKSTRFCGTLCRQRSHRARNRVEHALGERIRRLKISTSNYRVTTLDIERLLIRQQSRCFYCGALKKLTIDHVIPVSRGGQTSVGNIVMACRTCNSRKGSKTVMEFRIYCRNSEFKELMKDKEEMGKLVKNFQEWLHSQGKTDIIDTSWPVRKKENA